MKKERFSSPFVFWQRASKGFSVLEGPIHQCSLTVETAMALQQMASSQPVPSSSERQMTGTKGIKFCSSHALCSEIPCGDLLSFYIPSVFTSLVFTSLSSRGSGSFLQLPPLLYLKVFFYPLYTLKQSFNLPNSNY